MPPTSPRPNDLPNPGGDWLFRKGELVLGPLPGQALVDMLYRGEVDGRTEVQRMGTQGFRALSQVESFKIHLARSQAKLRVDAVARAHEESVRRQRVIKGVMFTAIAVVSAGLAAYVAVYLAVHKPWKKPDELAFADIEIELPTISRAKPRVKEPELIAYPGARRPLEADRKPRPTSAGSPGSALGGGRSDEPDGLETATFDQAAINKVVSRNQKRLHSCIALEAQKQPGMAAKIPIEFVIANDGRVNKVWVDHPQFKNGTLPDCLLKELKSWQFEPYEGERATVGLTFKIGKS
jgi:hypothetical protein